MKKLLSCLFAGTLFLFAVTGCTTAMYSAPSAVAKTQNQYQFTIETGGFSGSTTADKRAIAEITTFMKQHNYTRYKIVHRTDEFIPSGFKYVVQFYK
tara:strand:+ start:18941 stop:19231 length:291 start_codon:yes stop_codon:yes gene_type:complete